MGEVTDGFEWVFNIKEVINAINENKKVAIMKSLEDVLKELQNVHNILSTVNDINLLRDEAKG